MVESSRLPFNSRVILILVALGLLGLRVLIVPLDRHVERRIGSLLAKVNHLGVMQQDVTLNPGVDVRMEILRAEPTLATDAEALIRAGVPSALTTSQFRLLFNYHFLLENHEELHALAIRHDDVESVIDHIDFVYLLPALLYERLGLVELSRAYYSRYFLIAKELSTLHPDLFYAKSYQRRLSVVRVKLAFLEEALPSLRSDYYKVSFLTALLDDFFELSLYQRGFLAQYKSAGLVGSPRLDLTSIDFHIDPLRGFVARHGQLAPYARYELCVASATRFLAPSECHLETLLAGLPGAGHLLTEIARFTDALRAPVAQRPERLRAFRTSSRGKGEFLRDDAAFFEMLALDELGRVREARTVRQELLGTYTADGYDAVNPGRDWHLSEPSPYEERLQPRRAPDSAPPPALTSRQVAPSFPTAADGGCVLQVGAFRSEENAVRLRDRLRSENLARVSIKRTSDDSGITYKVIVGPMASEAALKRTRQRLASVGVGDAFSVSCPPDSPLERPQGTPP